MTGAPLATRRIISAASRAQTVVLGAEVKLANPVEIPVGEEGRGHVAVLGAVGTSLLALADETGAVQVNRLRGESALAWSGLRVRRRAETDEFEFVFRAAPREPGAAMRSVVGSATPAGGAVLCTLADGAVAVIPIASPQQPGWQRSVPNATSITVGFVDRDELVVAGSAGDDAWAWAPEAGDGALRCALSGKPFAAEWLRLTNPPLLAVAERSGAVAILKYGGGALRLLAEHQLEPSLAAMRAWTSPDSVSRLVTGTTDGSIKIWLSDPTTGALGPEPRELRADAGVRDLSVNRGLLAALVDGSRIKLWELDGDREADIDPEGEVRSFAVLRTLAGYPVVAWVDGNGVATVGGVKLESSERRPARIRVSDDRPLSVVDQDLLDFGSYVTSFSILIAGKQTATPLVVAIDGEWGTGKTSLGRMIDAALPHSEQTIDEVRTFSLWFNAWNHNDADDIATAIAGAVSAGIQAHRPWWQRLVSPRPPTAINFLRRNGRVVVALATVGVGALFLIEPATLDTALTALDVSPGAPLFSLAGLSVGFGMLRLLGLAWGRFGSAIEAFLRASKEVAREGRIGDVRDELGRRIAGATRPIPNPDGRSSPPRWWARLWDRARIWVRDGSAPRAVRPMQRALRPVLGVRPESRLVLFVDDLDRCRPERAVQVCETISQLLDHPRLVTVVLVDLEAIAADGEVVFQELAERVLPGQRGAGWGRRFLDKIFQFEFTIPSPRPDSLRGVLQVSVTGQRVEPDVPASHEPLLGDVASAADDASARLASLGELTTPSSPVSAIAGVLGDQSIWYSQALRQQRVRSASSDSHIDDIVNLVNVTVVTLASVAFFDKIDNTWLRVLVVAGAIAVVGTAGVLFESRGRASTYSYDDELMSPTLAGPRLGGDIPRRASTPHAEDASAGAGPPVAIRRRDQIRTVLRESDHLDLGRREAERWLGGASPRTAKRLANRLLFTMAIATDRGLLWNESPIDGRIIGKWVALVERWPQLAGPVRRRPDLLERIEGSARECARSDFAAGLANHVPNVSDPEGLWELLTDDLSLSRHSAALARLAQ